jgi:hypothetical protein
MLLRMQAVVVHERRVVVHASHVLNLGGTCQKAWTKAAAAMVLREWGHVQIVRQIRCQLQTLNTLSYLVEPISWMSAGLVIGFGIGT